MTLISYMARILFDFGALSRLGEEAARLGIARPLIVTDAGVAAAGHVGRALAALGRGAPVFDATPSNPTEAAANVARELFRAEGCDGLIALGGGSATDLAKAVGLLATHQGTLADYAMATADRIGPIVPLLAVPTAAGTGAEIGRAAAMTSLAGEKIACVSLELVPRTVICDPELTLTLPARMTAATGMDALTHGIEAALSTTVNPPAEAIALDCVARVAAWLPRAVAAPGDRTARWEMMMGALEGGLALQKGLGAVHAASMPLGARDLHHGELNAILLPHVLRFNRAYAEAKIARLERLIGLDQPLEDWCARLVADLGLPTGLAELGVTRRDIPALAVKAEAAHLNLTNPKPADAREFEAILGAALGGVSTELPDEVPSQAHA
jgi:hypothetical protein